MTVTNASSLLAEASACRWSQLIFAKRWNELRLSRSMADSELLDAFWSLVVVAAPPPAASRPGSASNPSSPSSYFDDDLSFLDSFDLDIDKELSTSFVSFLVASGQLSPESVWSFVNQQGGLTKHEHGKLQIEIIGDLLKSTVIALLSLSNESNSPIASEPISDSTPIAKFKLLLEIKSNLLASICDFLTTHWDFNHQLTCLRLSKWLDIVSMFERSGPLKAYCQFTTSRAISIIESWKRLQHLALSMAALERSAITIKETLITMSNKWISRSRMTPFSNNSSSSPTKNGSTIAAGDGNPEVEFCSLFCGAVDYLYSLEFGSNVNRFSSSEFLIPLLRSMALSMTVFVAASNNESAITQQLTVRYVPLLNHVASSLGVSIASLFELIEHSAKTSFQQPPASQQPQMTKKFATNFVDTRPSYLLKVFAACRLSCLAKSLNVNTYNGAFISELITNAQRDITRAEFEDYVAKELLKNLHIAPFLNRTEITRLHLVLAERASKEDNHLALGVLGAVELFRCFLVTGPGVDKASDGIIPEGAVGTFLENIVNRRIKNFASLVNTTDDDDGCDHHQDANDGHLLDLDTFMSTLPDSLAESVGIGIETASRLLYLLCKTDSGRLTAILRRLVFANPTLAFILWLLVDEKLRRRQVVCARKDRNDSPPSKKSKKNASDANSMESLMAISEALKVNFNMLKPPFNAVYSLLLTLSSQVRSLALVNRFAANTNGQAANKASNDPVTVALKQPGILNHYCVMRELALPEGTFKSGDSTAASLGATFYRVLASSSGSNGTGVDTSEGYHNFLAFSLPLVAGLDAETFRFLFKRWFSTEDGILASSLLCSASPGVQLSFIVAAQVWNFSFFLILLATSSSWLTSDDIKQILGRFFADWHRGVFVVDAKKSSERFRFVAVEMFFAELLFFANVSVCRLVAASLPSDFILNFVTSSTPTSAAPTKGSSPTRVNTSNGNNNGNNGANLVIPQSPVSTCSASRLLQLKRRVLGRLFVLDENNRFDEDFCIRAVCSLSPFDTL